ncbi:MAG: hypothetical protein AAFY06_00040 [Pseudomonadota bacterium]
MELWVIVYFWTAPGILWGQSEGHNFERISKEQCYELQRHTMAGHYFEVKDGWGKVKYVDRVDCYDPGVLSEGATDADRPQIK